MTSETDNKVEAAVERMRELADDVAAMPIEIGLLNAYGAQDAPALSADLRALISAKEAADQRCDRLAAEVETYRMANVSLKAEYIMLKAERDEVEAKLSALVEALGEIADEDDAEISAALKLAGCRDIARQALASLDRTAPETAEPAQEVAGLVEQRALDIAEAVPRHFRYHVLDWTSLHQVPQAHLDQAEAELRSVIVAEVESALSSSPSQGGETVDRSGVAAADNNQEVAEPSWRTFLASDKDWLADHGRKMGSGVGQQAVERLLVALDHVPAGNNHKALVEALERIKRWEMPETGRFWPDAYGKPDPKRPMSYASCCGSMGEQAVVRAIARDALVAFQSRKEESRG